MVSVHLVPPPDQDLSRYCGYYRGGNQTELPGREEYNNNLMEIPPLGNVLGLDDPNKKIRKPYTITKSRESWTDQEHDKFVEALHLFDRDWKKIEAFVGSKSVIQIRSHAQKYFLKVQKNRMSEHVPPPRPKRKASHPYPHKEPKNVVSRAIRALQSSTAPLEPGYAATHNSLSICRDPSVSASLRWTCNVAPPGCLAHVPKDDVGLGNVANNYSCSSDESTPHLQISDEVCREAKVRQRDTSRVDAVMPDFTQVYSFIGSVFDPSASDPLERLKNMDPINVETAVLLMKNLAANLSSPEFENQRKMLSLYKTGVEVPSY